ncbi:MAG: protein TolQ [Geminicoccaceae bacterium]
MEETGVQTATIGDAVSAGVGVWDLIADADIVVKAVMLLLLVASLWTWAVIFDRGFRLGRIRKLSTDFEQSFWSGIQLDELYQTATQGSQHPMAVMFAAALEEWREAKKPSDLTARMAVLQRIAKVMSLTSDREIARLDRNLGTLATIGSVAPFVGLFGTVWGIMNSFQSIAVTKNTTLAVVAPGIAEALLATALGLIAAIPAVIAYNRFSGELDAYSSRLDSFADEIGVVFDREIDAGRLR